MKTFMTIGLSAALALTLPAEVAAQGCATSGSTFTTNLAGNGQQGNMFDIAPSVDMTIECVDVYWTQAGDSITFELYYCPVTSVGNETNPAVWTQLGTTQTIATTGAGATVETIDVSGNGVVFTSGQTYGFYVVATNYAYPTTGFLLYTTQPLGPQVYTGDHCDITTNAGVFGIFGGTFLTRDFNGELHTELTGPATPALALACANGLVTADFSNMTAGGPIAIIHGPAGVFVAPGPQCAGLGLDLVPLTAPLMINADANGDAQVVKAVNAAVCGSGILVQGVDAVTCIASNSAAL